MANMFAKNAAANVAGGFKRKAADVAPNTAQDADALLEDILAGVGGDAAAAVPMARPAARPLHR